MTNPISTSIQLRRAFKIVNEIYANDDLPLECKPANAIAVIELALQRCFDMSRLPTERKIMMLREMYLRRFDYMLSIEAQSD